MSGRIEQVLISHYYQPYFDYSDRKWRRLGLRYTDIKTGTLDDAHIAQVFEECSKDSVPSRLASLYLIWAQVRVIRGIITRSHNPTQLLIPFTYGIHAEILYDRLTDRMLTKHKSVITEKGVLSNKFTKSPVAWILNVVRRTIQDSIYDMYRYEHDKRKGCEVRLRAPGRKVLLDNHVSKKPPQDMVEIMELKGYTEEDSPWAEMERLNTGTPLWEN